MQFKKTGISEDELVSKCLLAFELALNKYVPGKNTFFSYWKSVADNRMNDALNDIKDFNQNKAVKDIVHLSDSHGENGHQTVEEIIGEKDRYIFGEISTHEIISHLKKNFKKLSNFEKEVFVYLVEGYSVDEISKITNSDKSYIYHAIASLRRKVNPEIIKRYFK